MEFDVEDVQAATAELEEQGYTLLVAARTEPWGQIVTRLLSPLGTNCHSPAQSPGDKLSLACSVPWGQIVTRLLSPLGTNCHSPAQSRRHISGRNLYALDARKCISCPVQEGVSLCEYSAGAKKTSTVRSSVIV
jgi:hypothetical protein